HRVGDTLAEGAGGGFDSGGLAVLGVAGGFRMQLAEVFQLGDGQVVAGEVEQGVDQHGAVAVGEHETVPVGPLGVGRIVAQDIVPQHFGDIRHAHGGARVAAVGLLDGVHTEGADGIGEVAAG